MIYLLFIVSLLASCTQADNPLVINGKSDVIQSGLKISNSKGPCITIKNSSQIEINGSTLGPCKGPGVSIESSQRVSIQNNKIDHAASGVYALTSKNITISSNTISAVQGPLPRGQLVQFDKVTTGTISQNTGNNPVGSSHMEDAISVYESDHIQVLNNQIRGGGPSTSGGGIMLGDNGGSDLLAQGNTLTDPGQYGIAVSGGKNIRILNNTVNSSQHSYSNVGIYVWNQTPLLCTDITVSGNQVKWINEAGNLNNKWNGGGCTQVIWK